MAFKHRNKNIFWQVKICQSIKMYKSEKIKRKKIMIYESSIKFIKFYFHLIKLFLEEVQNKYVQN